MLHWGATRAEVDGVLPGDEVLPAADLVSTRAITIDARRRELTIDVPEQELAARRSRWKAPAPRYTAGVLAKYARLVSSSSIGAVTDG